MADDNIDMDDDSTDIGYAVTPHLIRVAVHHRHACRAPQTSDCEHPLVAAWQVEFES
jgi:hypothetical protein